MHEDSESDLIFSNFVRKSGQKPWFIARFGYISIYSKMGKFIINPCFWPLLHQQMQKKVQIRNPRVILRRHVLNQNLKIAIFRDFRANTFEKFLSKMCDFYRNISREYDFWSFFRIKFRKIRVPSENIDFFPSIDIYTSNLSIVKVDLAKADIWNVLLTWTHHYKVESQI